MAVGIIPTQRDDKPADDASSPVYRLFVASPGDLQRERTAVEQVVADINRADTGIRIDVVRWEQYSAPHWERPQEAVFLNTQFERTDLFIALFWGRMGTPSGKRDPLTNEPYLSGTVEELQAAVQRYRDKKLRRILVYFCDRKKKCRTRTERQQWDAVQAFRKKLDDEKSVLYKQFTTTDRFKLALRADLDLVAKELRQEIQRGGVGNAPSPVTLVAPPALAPPPPTAAPPADLAIGDDVPRMCDRDDHDAEFYAAFTEGFTQEPGTPHAYVIYGDERQGLDSLSIRFGTTIRKRVLLGGTGAPRVVSVPEHRIRWPNSESGNLKPEQYRAQLASSLVRSLDAFSVLRETTAQALVSLDAFRRTPCVVIHHDIPLTSWSPATSTLVEWYLNEYWAALAPDPTRATIIVFIKLSCPPTMSDTSRLKLLGRSASVADVRAALDRIVTAPRPGCRRVVLDELRSVTRYDVKQWFANYGIYRSEEERIVETDRLFGAVGAPNEVDALPMAVVEKRLMEIHEFTTRSTGQRAS